MACVLDSKGSFCLNVSLLLVSLCVGLAICEVVVRTTVSVTNVGPTFSAYDPVYGKRLKKRFSATRIAPEYTMTLTTNSWGFRDLEWPSLPEQPILFLGDSFTMGYGVNDGEEFPALVRQTLDDCYGPANVSVVNTGIAGNGTGRWVKFLRDEGKTYDPRVVVLQFFSNDFDDNLIEQLFQLDPNGRLYELEVPPPRTLRSVQNFLSHIPGFSSSHLVGFIRQLMTTYAERKGAGKGTRPKEDEYPTDRLTFALVKEVLALCAKEKWPVLALTVGLQGSRLDKLETLFERAAIPVIQMPDKMARPDLYYPQDGHWNASGHLLAARLIVEKLASLNHIAITDTCCCQ